MRTEFMTKKLELTQKEREKILRKLSRLNRFFEDDDRIVINPYSEGNAAVVELTVYAKGTFFRAEQKNRDVLCAVDDGIDVIEGQIRKFKTKLEKKLRRNAYEAFPEADEREEEELKITNVKQFVFRSMSAEDAVLQMNLLGHQFYVFKNEDTDSVCVVYRRSDGSYGMIEPVE